jgi:hypothetical protein
MKSQSGEASLIDAAEAQRLVGKALYGDDWIGELSKKELDLLSGPYGPQRKRLSNGRAINIILRCPPHLRDKLDLAWGRAEHAYLQTATAIDVLHDHGFKYGDKVFDLGRIEKLLAKISQPDAESKRRSVGKPPDKIEGVKMRMASDMRGGIDLDAMKQEALAAKYGVSRGTAVKAKQEVLEKQQRK